MLQVKWPVVDRILPHFSGLQVKSKPSDHHVHNKICSNDILMLKGDVEQNQLFKRELISSCQGRNGRSVLYKLKDYHLLEKIKYDLSFRLQPIISFILSVFLVETADDSWKKKMIMFFQSDTELFGKTVQLTLSVVYIHDGKCNEIFS